MTCNLAGNGPTGRHFEFHAAKTTSNALRKNLSGYEGPQAPPTLISFRPLTLGFLSTRYARYVFEQALAVFHAPAGDADERG